MEQVETNKLEFPMRYEVSKEDHARQTEKMKPITKFYAEAGKVYEIQSPVTKDRIMFKCSVSGWVKVKYKHRNGYDSFDISGKGVLDFDDELTIGMNEKRG